jgi:hypothetical protein
MSELSEQVKNLPPVRQLKGNPAIRALKYWQENCPSFLASLGSDAENAAILRQNQYLDRFDQLIDQAVHPMSAHQMADSEIIYQPTAEVDPPSSATAPKSSSRPICCWA